MAINVMSYVWEHSTSKGNDLLALLAIADQCNQQGDCFAGMDRLAEKARVTVRGFQNIVERLEYRRELFVYPNMGTRTMHGITNAYRIPMKGVNENIPLTTPVAISEKKLDIAPRPAKTPKHQPFPELKKDSDDANVSSPQDADGVNVSSSSGVNVSSPQDADGVNVSSSSGVNVSSPISVSVSVSSLHPSENPSDIAPSGAPNLLEQYVEETLDTELPQKTRKKKSSGKPKPQKERKPNPAQPHHDALLIAFGHDPANMTSTADRAYWICAAELRKVEFAAEDIANLYIYVKERARREGWSSFTVMSLSKYLPEYLKRKAYEQRKAEEEAWENTEGKSELEGEARAEFEATLAGLMEHFS